MKRLEWLYSAVILSGSVSVLAAFTLAPPQTSAPVVEGGTDAPSPIGTGPFVNWESPHVSPICMTPDGTRLLAVNTADNRLEVFSIATGTPVKIGAVPVGLDPVTVRARTNSEAWVVNHVSDSVSIVDLGTMNVRATLPVGDEPSDVVFAGAPQRAFVSVSQANKVMVYDPANLGAAPSTVAIQGESPRALATDGTRVFAAIFESGNNTTILGQAVVSSAVNPYPGDANPPPNSGTGFFPTIAPGLPTPPPAGLIVQKQPDGTWRDDNNGNWSGAVTWGLSDNDVAIIDASTLATTYARGLMNANMAISVRPDAGGARVTVVGTEAINIKRFEPNVRGIFVQDKMASIDPASPGVATIVDLNPHLDYSVPQVVQAVRDQSIGDPRAVAWNSAGTTGYVAGMGSGNVIVISAAGARLATINVGQGPTGIALAEGSSRAYVLNKFDGTISVLNTASNAELSRVSFYDPTPTVIKAGRPFLYDTHRTSGLGQLACASCHIDGKTDQLAWDLGDPTGQMKTFNQVCNFGLAGGCGPWHPMKGPMTTQTLFGIVGDGPMHWRADREDLAAFNGAFVSLLGDDTQLTTQEMADYTNFVNTLTPPPNPNRNFNGSLKTSLFNGGNPQNGSNLFQTVRFDGSAASCSLCHALPTGTNHQLTSGNLLQEPQSMKIPQLRNMYEKGFDRTSMTNSHGFGFTHDGSVPTLVEFLQAPVFTFDPNPATALQQRKDLEAFLFSFATDTYAGVGTQTTVSDGTAVPPTQSQLITDMIALAQAQTVGLVVKGVVNGEQRGFAYLPASSIFQSDRQAQTFTPAALLALATPGGELTYTVVPNGSQTRIGIDRDSDGWLDRNERDVCSDPANPAVFPGSVGSVDVDASLVINSGDVTAFLNRWFNDLAQGTRTADFDGNNLVNSGDVTAFLNAWFIAVGHPC